MGLEINSLLNERYRKKRQLVQSGMGTLFLAHDEILNVDVAIKVNKYASTDHSIQFRQEAMILARLRHPNLPRVIDHFVIKDQGEYLVMDYIEGVDLFERLKQQGHPFSEAETVEIGITVSDALIYLHSRQPPIIHRDIKPANLKRTPEGRIMLLDFGLAKHYLQDEVTAVGAKGVTAGYSPVEQYGQGTDARSDIYALGATLYTLLTDQVPPDSVERAIGMDDLEPIDVYHPGVSEALQEAIYTAMSVKAEDRYQSVAEFQAALKLVVPQEAVPDSRSESGLIPSGEGLVHTKDWLAPTVLSPRTQAKKKKRFLIWLMPLLAVLCVGALAGMYFLQESGYIGSLFPQAPSPTALAALVMDEPTATTTPTEPEPNPTATLAAIIDTPETLPSPTLQPSPSPTAEPVGTPQGGGQGQIAFVSERTGFPQIFLLNLADGTMEQITSEPEGACQPAWSPDGMRLAYISPCDGRKDRYDGASIFIYDFRTGRTDLISFLAAGDYDPAWSPDGNRLAFTSLQNGRPQIFLYDFATSDVRQMMDRATINRMPAWSPDGTQIVFVTLNPVTNQPTLFIVDAEGQEEPKGVIAEDIPEAYRPDWTPAGDWIVYDLGGDDWLGGWLMGRKQDAPIQTHLAVAESPDFSPDGQWLACDGVLDLPRHDIFVMLRTGARLQRLTDDPAEDYQADWRPAITP
jgi:serine/threonine protein kinase